MVKKYNAVALLVLTPLLFGLGACTNLAENGADSSTSRIASPILGSPDLSTMPGQVMDCGDDASATTPSGTMEVIQISGVQMNGNLSEVPLDQSIAFPTDFAKSVSALVAKLPPAIYTRVVLWPKNDELTLNDGGQSRVVRLSQAGQPPVGITLKASSVLPVLSNAVLNLTSCPWPLMDPSSPDLAPDQVAVALLAEKQN